MFGRIGLQLYSVRNHMEDAQGVKDTFRRLAEIGYKEVQTAGGFPGGVEEFAKAARENGIEIIGTHCGFPENLDDISEYVNMHRTLGTVRAGVGGGRYGGTAREINNYIDSVNTLAEKLAGYGMKFTYHHHTHEFARVDGRRVIDYMIDGFDRKNVSFVLDTYWLNHAGCDVNAWIRKLEGSVEILHLKDKAVKLGSNDGYITEVGGGNLDFETIIKTAEDAGVGHLCVEQDTWPAGFDSIDCAAKSYEYLAKLLKL